MPRGGEDERREATEGSKIGACLRVFDYAGVEYIFMRYWINYKPR